MHSPRTRPRPRPSPISGGGTSWSPWCSGSPRSRCSWRRSSSRTRSRSSSRSAPGRSPCSAASARASASCAGRCSSRRDPRTRFRARRPRHRCGAGPGGAHRPQPGRSRGPLPSTIGITPAVVLVPLVVGTAVTLLASLVPAREATRVAPIAALRPADAPAFGARAGRIRLAISLALVVGGAGVLLLTAVASSRAAGSSSLQLAVGCSPVPSRSSACWSGRCSGCRGSSRCWVAGSPRPGRAPGSPRRTRCATHGAPPRPAPPCSSGSPSSS